jgi:ABC-type methionine transport system permease subunit
MWQRIQTVFLAMVAICMAIAIFLPIGIFIDPSTGDSHQLYPIHYTIVSNGTRVSTYFPYVITSVLMAAAATLAVISITKFENRITQVKIGTLNSLVLAVVMVAMVWFFNPFAKQYPGGKLGLDLWITFAGVTFNWLALRFIRRDEKMVRDSDRLR